MNLANGVAVGSSIQIALLITPLMVLLAWPMGAEMSLFFNIFDTAILFVAVMYRIGFRCTLILESSPL
jgi:Ca2+:H+ antiporter